LKENPNSTKIDGNQSDSYISIDRRSLEIDQCERELKEIEDGNGQNFLLLSADHGGGTLKLFLQNLTTAKPNSAANGYLVGEMDAPEKYENLKAAFGHYQDFFLNLFIYFFLIIFFGQ